MTPPRIALHVVSEGYDRIHCWVHARVAAIPGVSAPRALITTQPLWLAGSDIFYEINTFLSEDLGQTWSGPQPHRTALGRRPGNGPFEECLADLTPGWHAATGVVLATGLNGFYQGNTASSQPSQRKTCYSVYHPQTQEWMPWKKLESPLIEGAGCTQRVDLPDGRILLPTYRRTTAPEVRPLLCAATVMECHFDGETLRYLRHGDELTLPTGRGFVEPSLIEHQGRFYLTLRNDEAGYVATSDDGLHYGPPQRWRFDDGSDLGNYNTQQHWLTGGGGLYLVYTRRGANNDHVMRHRAPLFLARVDPERLCVLRDTEQILIPEHGARLGNFGVAHVSDRESWVSVAEWMQTTAPNPHDSTVCERYGANNRIYFARVLF